MRRFQVSAALAAVSSVGALLVPWSGISGAADPTVLPMTSFSHLLMDNAHSHVLLTDGAKVVVRALDGSPVTEIAEPGASGMALSPDGKTLYVALTSANAIAAINTSTLAETARYATGANTCPATVQPVAAKVWFGYGCTAGKGAIGLLAWALGKPSVALNRATGFNQAPELRFTTTIANKLFASGDFGRSAPVLKSFPITSNTSLGAAVSRQLDNGLADMNITTDGKFIVTASAADYFLERFSTANLAYANPDAPAAYYVNGVATGSTGLVAAGTTSPAPHDAYVSNASGSLVKVVDVDGTIMSRGLAFDASGKTLYAVTLDGSGGLHLQIVQHADQADVSIALTGSTSVAKGQSLTIRGTARSLDTGLASRALTVQRTDASGTTALASVSTAYDGTFQFTDTPPVLGTATYTVSYAGDAARLPATASMTVQVAAAPTTMSLTGTSNIALGSTEELTAALWSGQTPVVNASVGLSRTDANGTIQLGQFTTDGNGRVVAHDTPGATGTYTYVATFPGTADLQASSASLKVTVNAAASALTLSVPQSSPVGQPVSLSGNLTYAGNPVPDATITISRIDSSGASVQVAEVRTGTAGSYSAKDTPSAWGDYTYRAAFAGTTAYPAATATRQVHITATPTSLTLTGPQSAAAGQPIVLTGTLAVTGGMPIGGATIHVGASGSGNASGAQWQPASVVTDAQGHFTITDTPPSGALSSATYYVRFYGDAVNGASENKWTVQLS